MLKAGINTYRSFLFLLLRSSVYLNCVTNQNYAMFKSYLKIAIRKFRKDAQNSFINLAGLIAGLTSVFIIAAYVKYELSYDKHYTNSSRIYRLVHKKENDGVQTEYTQVPSALGYALQHDIPGIEATTFMNADPVDFFLNAQPVKQECIFADSRFFNIFNLPLKYGNGIHVLQNRNDVVISETMANKFYPGQNPVGKNLTSKDFNGKPIVYSIKGVMYNIPSNTHFKADAVISAPSRDKDLNWRGYRAVTQYIMLNKNISITQIEKKLPVFYTKYNFDQGSALRLQPVTSIHLHSNIPDEHFSNSNISYVYVFFFAALLILLIGCINYINLNTARSLQRVKEIGVRKVIGAKHTQLSVQFIMESTIFFCAALPFSLLAAYILWPLFTRVVNVQVGSGYLIDAGFIFALLGITLAAGVMAGTYAAFFVSRLRPAHILKDWQKSFAVNMAVRKALIVLQFAVSVTLVMATIIVNQQLRLLNNMQLGFNKKQVVMLPNVMFINSPAAFKSTLLQNTHISSVSVASWNAGYGYGGSAASTDPNDSTKNWEFSFIYADEDFFKTMEIKMLEGRPFSAEYTADDIKVDSMIKTAKKQHLSHDEINKIDASRSIIITRTVADLIGLKGPVTGKVLNYSVLRGTVVGEAPDFLGTSLLQKAHAVIMCPAAETRFGNIYIKLSPGNIPQTIGYIHQIWQRFFPDKAFDFVFVEDKLNKLYDEQQRMAAIFNSFASLAIIIALLGLFSLVALTVQQKTKEIGIRKVLGANITDILKLVSKGYLGLILVASAIAVPVAWWGMNSWLQGFNYRVNIHWLTFAIVVASCLFLALASITAQTLKAAKANPVNTLRTD